MLPSRGSLASPVPVTALVLAAAAAGATAAGQTPGAPTEEAPATSDLVEREQVRLVQVDVSVSGPPERIRELTADDFKVKVGLRRVRSFTFDNLCAEALAGTGSEGSSRAASGEAALGGPSFARPATFLLYFDQPLLTGGGRARALQIARGLVERLIRDGNRAMVVSNAKGLETYTDFTADTDVLLAALDALQDDRSQWDFYSTEESLRIAEIVDALNDGDPMRLVLAKARQHQVEERWRMEKSLRRLESVLPRLTGADPPKAVLYFADTLRSNGGEHYLSFFGPLIASDSEVARRMRADSATAPLPFDRVVNRAAAEGVRFYAIQGDDLQSFGQRSRLSSEASARTLRGGYSSRVRVTDAQETLESLSSETGGYAFLRGAPSERVAGRILEDLRCLCLISFEPRDRLVDRPYRVVVESLRPGVTVRSRGRLVVQSEQSRRAGRLLAAFTAPEAGETEGFEVRGSLVPLGFEKGSYVALAQVSLPGVPIADTTWDLGATLHGEAKVRAETSGRLSLEVPFVPLVLEEEVRFPPGPLEMVSVAMETGSSLISSSRREFDWPDPQRGPATIGPIAVLQSSAGVFLREGSTRNGGPVGLAEDQTLRTDRPVALVSLVCRGRGKRVDLQVDRRLRGREPVDFPPIDLGLEENRPCVQVRDVVPADTLGPGEFVYEIRIVREDETLASAERRLTADGDGG